MGAGNYGALTPLVIADVMRGSGRFNLAQGAVATMMGIGASVSALFAGEMVDHFGYSASFLALGATAAVAFLVFFGFMPETRDEQASACDSETLTIEGAPGRMNPDSVAALIILVLTYVGVAAFPASGSIGRGSRFSAARR